MTNQLQTFDLTALLPDSLKQDKFTVALAQAVSEEIQKINQEAESILSEDYPDHLLDLMAFEKHVDFYSPDLPVEQKRELIRKADFFHRHKGTPAAVEELISLLFDEGRVEEWFEYGGEPRRFQVVTNNSAVTNEKAQEFIKALNSVKRLRSVLERVIITQKEEMKLFVGAVVHTGDKKIIKQVM